MAQIANRSRAISSRECRYLVIYQIHRYGLGGLVTVLTSGSDFLNRLFSRTWQARHAEALASVVQLLDSCSHGCVNNNRSCFLSTVWLLMDQNLPFA